jgi:predicted small lipoprotein YifL
MRFTLAWAALMLMLAACGRKGPAPANPNAFDKAAPEIKQIWDAALTADKTNGYYASQALLFRLLQQPLAPEQQEAANQQLTATKARFTAALEKGDPAAKSALDEMRRNPPNRQR